MRPERAPALAELQRTLMRALHAPPGAASLRRAASWIRPRPQSTPANALALYRRLGAQRFEREVAREFPALRALLGDAGFGELARAFVAQRRSRSFTLDGYAATLPRFLARQRALGARGRAAAAALAHFELALRQAAGPAPDAPAAANDSGLRTTPVPGAKLLTLAWDAPTAVAAWRRSGALPAIAKRRTRVVVFAGGDRAEWLALSAREAGLLASLLRGAPLEHAVARAVRSGLSGGRIRRAFERWVARGLLSPARP